MIPFCRIVLTLVSCTLDPATPRTTPAEAVAVLTASVAPFVAGPWYDGPTVILVRSSPTAGPFGEFPALTPPRRLDGTWPWDPPRVYGQLPPWDAWPAYGVPFVAHRTPYRASSVEPRVSAAFRPYDQREARAGRDPRRDVAPVSAPVVIVGGAPMAGGSALRTRAR